LRLPLALTALLLIAGQAVASAAEPRAEAKVREARELIEELLLGEQKVVPVQLIEDTRCLAVFPKVVEAALGLGGSHGTGIASCRNDSGTWSAPVFLRVSGGSIGLQAGFRQVDLLLFVVTEEGAASLGRSSFSLGGEASFAAGKLDRRAEVSTDSRFEEDFYLFARARGLFAGASLEGTRLNPALDRMESYYGELVFPGEVLSQQKRPPLPAEAELLLGALASLPD
jgi:SH3 domain-containing YSC84-like protein 1